MHTADLATQMVSLAAFRANTPESMPTTGAAPSPSSSKGLGSATVPLTERYRSFVEKITEIRVLKKFEALKSFLSLDEFSHLGNPDHVGQTLIVVGTFESATSGGGLQFNDIAVKDLASSISDGDGKFQLFIVQNITPEVVKILGGHLEVDPQFFLDFIDAMPGEFDITKEKERCRRDIVPTPWYLFQSPEAHLPMLHSLRRDCEHIQLRFVAPRQYNKLNNHNAEERMRPDLRKMKVERTAGLQTPVARKTGRGGRQFDNVAMTRHCASMWFKSPADPSNSKWIKGIVLLDPPFEVDDAGEKKYGRRLPSVYRSFFSRPLPFDLEEKNKDVRSGYANSLVHYLKHCSKLRLGGGLDAASFHPILIAEGINRIVASEWIATNMYIERALNTMEWRLESTKVGIRVLENFLLKLFTLRRRIGKYAQLVDEQMSLFQKDQLPTAWTAHLPELANGVLRSVQQDSAQVRDIVQRNAERVSKTVELIMSLLSVRESQESVKQNDSLKFLTMVATVILPFNAIAAIMAVQGRYSPDGDRFWVLCTISASLCAVIWAVYGLIRGAKRLQRRFVGTYDKVD